MKIEIHNRCSDFNSYRAARVKSLFNAESGCNFDLIAELPIEDDAWKIGLIVGPSGSGKTSMGKTVFGPDSFYEPNDWPEDKPIIDAIAPHGDFNNVTGALAAVGLGSVPTWLRPYPVLSNGEKFRANLARVICEAPREIVIDEFTSVVDRQIAKFGALAFQKAWKRTGGRCILLSCHYDIVEWVEPDWVFDTATGQYSGRGLWRRPKFELEIYKTDGSYWPMFEPHHYLKLPRMIACDYFVGAVEDKPVCHIGFSARLDISAMRAGRMVVMPEWQGAGIGLLFLNTLSQMYVDGLGRYGDRINKIYCNTSHPGLSKALRGCGKWLQVSVNLYGENKIKSGRSIKAKRDSAPITGYGGHFRAVQGFKYLGKKNVNVEDVKTTMPV
jgi:GNAT superfamily N-acetyltransferase